MTPATSPACIGEPVSWLRLEMFALSRTDAGVAEHVAACPACRHCLEEVADDVVALPVLSVPAKRRPWWHFAIPALAAAAAVAVLLFVLRPRENAEEGIAHVKGLGEVVIDVVRERSGTVRDDVRSFAPGDRWKIVVTCALDKTAQLDASVLEQGAAAPDHPLAPASIVCGNRVVIPGAFTLTGDKPHRVCVKISARTGSASTASTACLTIRAE